MKRNDDRLVPVLLIGAQALVWPGAALVRGTVPASADLLVVALVAGLVGAALALLRTRPVGGLALVVGACALGAGPSPAGALAVLGTAGVALALFTVATERDTFTAVLCVVTLAVWQLLYGVSLHGLSDRDGLDLVLTALLYVAACGAGLLVRRRRRALRAAERRLKRAEAERHRLPAVERRRMERELHDVSAHHLTAVVVTAGAALGLRDRRPELADEALEFAAETGREVTRALGAVRAPAPSREEVPSPEERLRELVAGFGRLGGVLSIRPDEGAGSGAVDREAEEGGMAEPWRATTTQGAPPVPPLGGLRGRGAAPGTASPARSARHPLGRQVDCEIDPLPDGAVADAAYGIVREALTNVARHAPGAHTTVLCRYGDTRTDVVITSGAPPAGSAAHGAGLGSGRGQAFLRSRAREAGGTLSSGPTDDGGWEVRAVLPGRTAAPVERSVTRGYRAAQVTVAVGLCLQPLLPTLIVRAEEASSGPHVSAGLLFALLASAQAVALLWVRRAPRVALGALFALALLWPVAMAEGAYAGPVLLPPVLSALATCAALAVDAARATAACGTAARTDAGTAARGGEGRALRWTCAAVAVHAAAVTAAVLDRGTTVPAWAVVPGAIVGSALAVAGARWAGARRGRHDRADRGARDERLAVWTGEAVRDAWAERRRIAAGLETTVLSRTTDMVAEAEAGRLDATADRAREALAAMRALLDTVRDGETAPELRPQPTVQALDLLAHQCRATGRDVEIRLTDRVPDRLPTEVDLAAYHVAETVLSAGGDEPATLELDADGDTLTLAATGVPSAARPVVRERLAARVGALGGTLDTEPPGPVRLRLPLITGAPVTAGAEGER